ncbi:hypothetical protein MPTK1_6g08950 [Marchantia polymorpha subsp. ruderalis]|uniref:Secreted protein n=2 Tax=Marchantia polymorpha TaxID=3197 RepID=A0AAF6BQ28_MARPO|nr:hypothetical protein MARPO_0060s0024 [Marchantia polymorpha]BBN14112.1 hypothetical protein Mp_6g08950 [Marchantia polymorpha subsp. ruderalis]|eukprot:PTQ36931.1 hypothetical protein MARPO_0060s0024 [Marchantia polymorpha]
MRLMLFSTIMLLALDSVDGSCLDRVFRVNESVFPPGVPKVGSKPRRLLVKFSQLIVRLTASGNTSLDLQLLWRFCVTVSSFSCVYGMSTYFSSSRLEVYQLTFPARDSSSAERWLVPTPCASCRLASVSRGTKALPI